MGKMREFLLALLDHKRGKEASINLRIADARHDIRNGSDVVEVAVGYKHALDLVLVLFEIAGVWQNEIDTRGMGFGELDTTVNNHDRIFVFDHAHVSPDFLDTA
jgi:hypothetical protein